MSMKGILSTGKSLGADVGAETRYIPGPQGEVGPRGPQGEKGDAFKYSDFTPEQLKDLTGPIGPIGPKGDKGDKGDTGAQGPKGDTGAGLKVLDYFPTFSALIDAVPRPNIGDAYGVGAAEPYDIYVYGATSGWKNNGPLQGTKGETGPKGDKGETGPAGADGKSAYQSAQDGGYKGDESQFNADLANVSSKEAAGTAASAVSEHNIDHSAHIDIRQSVSDVATAAENAQNAADEAARLASEARAKHNYLRNGYFADPLNLRGQTEYDGIEYGIDGWFGNNSTTRVTVNDGHITLSTIEGKTNIPRLLQQLDRKFEIGSTITFSTLLRGSNGGVVSVYGYDTPEFESSTALSSSTIGDTAGSWQPISTTAKVTKPYLAVRIQAGNKTGDSADLLVAKLEDGDRQTVAHLDENGNWVPSDAPPDKSLETFKCTSSRADSADAYANGGRGFLVSNTDLSAGTSALPNGVFYFVYN